MKKAIGLLALCIALAGSALAANGPQNKGTKMAIEKVRQFGSIPPAGVDPHAVQRNRNPNPNPNPNPSRGHRHRG